MNISQLHAEGEADLTLDDEQLDMESGKVPYKISKWLKYLTNEKLQLLLDEAAYQQGYKNAYRYYMLNFNTTLTKEETLKIYMPADTDLKNLDHIRKGTIEKMKYCEGVIKTLQSMTFTIKNMIEWRQFQHGR